MRIDLNIQDDFEVEKKILKKHGQKNYFITNSERLDPFGRLLKWKLLFPHELKLPFLMTYFNQDPKPASGFVHPNGIKSIKQVSYCVQADFIPLINDLCDDDRLNIFEGCGVKDIIYEKQAVNHSAKL